MTQRPYDSDDFWTWVEAHADADPTRLRLSAAGDKSGIDVSAAITQVECRQRYRRKLGVTLGSFARFYFASVLAGEQSTSDTLAAFHSRLVHDKDVVVDLTAGLGNDALRLARVADNVTAVERNADLVDALNYNARGLGISNLRTVHGDARQCASSLTGTVAFIDPARRAADGSRVYGLADCEPDVTSMLPDLRRSFKRLIIKASPMLDITQTIESLGTACDIYLIGTTTECKELLADVSLADTTVVEPVIHAVTLTANGDIVDFDFTRRHEVDATASIATRRPVVGDILYLPYPATMKAAPVKLLSQQFGLEKFHPNTHLYFGAADRPVADFPGEALRIIDVIPWQSKNIKRLKSRYPRLNVTVRNFGMSADALRKKTGVCDGEPLRLFGIGLGSGPSDRLLVVTSPSD